MALMGFVIVGVSPRQLGRVHSAALVRFTAPLIRWPLLACSARYRAGW